MIREADVDGDGQINYDGKPTDRFTDFVLIPTITEFVKVRRFLILPNRVTNRQFLSDDALEIINCTYSYACLTFHQTSVRLAQCNESGKTGHRWHSRITKTDH